MVFAALIVSFAAQSAAPGPDSLHEAAVLRRLEGASQLCLFDIHPGGGQSSNSCCPSAQ